MRRIICLVVCLLTFASTSSAQVIQTIAGGGPNNLPATASNLQSPTYVTRDPAGDILLAVHNGHRVFRVDASGKLTVVAGNGTPGFSGDGGPATEAALNNPDGVATDAAGNIFIADRGNQRIRRVDASTGIITTVAGNGSTGYNGDNIPAANASFGLAFRLASDSLGNLYIADYSNHRIRRVDHASGIITTVAGTGVPGYNGDNILATSATLYYPWDVALDGSGNLLIVDNSNARIRRVDHSTGIITTVAGGGSTFGEGGQATAASLDCLFGIAVDGLGNFFIAEGCASIVRRVDAVSGIITTVAGNFTTGFSGDGGAATSASLDYPIGLGLDGAGNLLIADVINDRIRRVNLGTGLITTFAGNGTPGYSGDAYAATDASLYAPNGVALDGAGNLFIADAGNRRIRRVDKGTGEITTVAGNGTNGFSGDGGLATSASLSVPVGIALDNKGNVFFADYYANSRIRRIDAVTGIITTVAGNGTVGFSGDGGPATSASLYYPSGVAVDKAGNLFIADPNNQRIRRVDASTGIITTVAGNGAYGYGGDGGPAVNATLGFPRYVALDGAGNLFIVDALTNRVRRVDISTGIITTVAGNGVAGYNGEGILATSANLNLPLAVALDGADNLYIVDSSNQRVRHVDASTGIISTVAGNGVYGFSGDGGPATSASLAGPEDVAIDAYGNLFIADYFNQRIREVDAPPAVGLSAANLNFGHEPYGTTSATQDVTVTNTGGGSINISSVSVSGDFTESDTCTGASLSSGGTCTASVSFLPTATGARAGMLTMNDNAPGSPHTVSLTGIGDPATTSVSIGAPSVTYPANGSVTVSVTSGPATVTGNVSLSVDGNPQPAQSLSSGSAVFTVTGLSAGSHNLSATYAAQGDFAASSATGTLTVNKANASVTPNAASKTYGTADPAFTGTLSGFVAADGVTATYSRTAGETVAASPYTISATLNAPPGVLTNYTITYNTASFTVTQAAASVTPIPASKTYGAADPSFTGTLSGFLAADNVTASYSRTAGETVAGGPYTISATLAPAGVLSNYAVTSNTASFTINPAHATVMPNAASKTYGTADPALTGTLTGFLAADNVTASYSRTAGETVAASPYTISATLNAAAGVLSNYVVTYNTASFTINPAIASVTPNPASKTYGTGDPAFTGTLSGFLAADNVTASYSRTAGETVAASPYTISATLNAAAGVLSNYVVTYNTASFTISPASASVTPLSASKTYGTTDPPFSGTLTGFLPADNVTASYSRTAGETVAGSPYAISASLAPAAVLSNYAITYNTASFTITQASASVTPNAASKTYGTSDPIFGGTLGGFLAADNVTASYSRTAGETVAGSPYTISATLSPAGVLSNYSVTYNTASFSINKASASVIPNAASKIYGSADPTLTGTLSGFVAADNVTASYSRTAGETVAGSPYTISATLAPAGVLSNYSVTYSTANFTITPASASVTPNATSKTYGTADPALTGTLSGFVPSDNVTATYSRTAGETVAGSPYTISATLNAAPSVLNNYSITSNTAAFTITQAASSTALIASPNPSTAGQLVAITATVTDGSPGSTGSPTGTVQFMYGGSPIFSPVALVNGSASIAYGPIVAGGVQAVYSGDPNFAGNNGPILAQVVTAAPIASVSPSVEVQFTNQALKTTSAPVPVTLSNNGTAALTISSINVSGTNSGDFAQTNNCPASLSPASSCIIYVTFSPKDTGERAATLNITDNDPFSSPQMVGLSGLGMSAIKSNFDKKPIAGGTYLWFSSSFKVSGPKGKDASANPVQVFVNNSTITFTAGGTPYTLSVPNAVILFDPNATTATTTWDATNNRWFTTVPSVNPNDQRKVFDVDGNTFLTGLAFPVPTGGLPGDIEPVTWSAELTTDTPGVSVRWRWGSAVYTSFNTDYSQLGVKPVDDSREGRDCQNSDDAGAPENYKKYWLKGATGDDRDDFTGDNSKTVGVPPTVAPLTFSSAEVSFGDQSVGYTSVPQTVTLTNIGVEPMTVFNIAVTGTNASDFTQTNNCPISPAVLSPSPSNTCTVSITFQPGDVGTRTAKLSITSGPNSGNQTTQTVDLGGNGTP